MLEIGPFIEEDEQLAREPSKVPLPFPPTAINLYSRSKGLCCQFYGMHGSTYDNGKRRPWCKTAPHCHRLLSAQLGHSQILRERMQNGLTVRALGILHDRILKNEKRVWRCKPCAARKQEAREARVAASIAARQAAAEAAEPEPAEPAESAPKKRRTA